MKEPLSFIAAEGFDHTRSLYRLALNVKKYTTASKVAMNAQLSNLIANQSSIWNQQSQMAE